MPNRSREPEAKERWAPIATIPGATLFVYVPLGYADEAKRLCREAKIDPEGFRTWRNTPQGFEINDVGEAHSTVRGLIPKFAAAPSARASTNSPPIERRSAGFSAARSSCLRHGLQSAQRMCGRPAGRSVT